LAAVGLAGWAGLPALKVETDPAQLMPASDPALLAAQSIRKEVGIAGEMDLVLKAEDAGADTTSQVPAQWLRDQTTQAVTASSGDLKRLQSLPDFLSGFNRGVLPDAARTSLILQRIPAYFSDAVVSRDHTLALSIFGLRNVTSVERDGALVQQLRSQSCSAAWWLRSPPSSASSGSAAFARSWRADPPPSKRPPPPPAGSDRPSLPQLWR